MFKCIFQIRHLLFFALGSLMLVAKGQGITTNPYSGQNNGLVVSDLNSFRSEIVLNGLWEFQPDTAVYMDPATPLKGKIMQPGSWLEPAWWAAIPGVKDTAHVFPGVDWKQVKQAWYRKQLVIPATWKGRKVELECTLVSTNAVVFIDGKKVGTIPWGGGLLDITKWVQFGKPQVMQVLVFAGTDEKEVPVFMGTATEQVSLAPASLASAGIIGDMVLRSRPPGAFIEDVFVKTSFRKKEATLEVTLLGVKKSGKVQWKASFYNGDQLEKQVVFEKPVSKADSQVLSLSFGWPEARIWDLDNPEMYTLVLETKGGPLKDGYTQSFGFREFWIEGKGFILNGKKIRLRPFETVNGGGMDEAIDAQLQGIRKAGFNFMELWPDNEAQRGYYNYYDRVAERADRQGFLISGVLQSLNRFITGPGWVYQWDKPEIRANWERWLARQMKRDRNHPSIIMWGTSANFFGSAYDQYPRNLGKSHWNEDNAFWVKNRDAALQAFEWVRAIWDNTRPIFTHHGAYVGDLHTVNMYLNLLPLQEREEWLSDYADKGTMPFMPIEFGTPFENTFLRGRNGFAKSVVTEPFMTEYSAMYLGPAAYRLEKQDYRHEIQSRHVSGDLYRSWQFNHALGAAPAFQQVQDIFISNTWRSWRTWGIPGGMLPWNKANGWYVRTDVDQMLPMPAFKPGRRGVYHDAIPASVMQYLSPEKWEVTAAGKALIANNNEYLAWIGGGPENFTDKQHHYIAGDTLHKQLVLINDSRDSAHLDFSWTISMGNDMVARGNGEVWLPPAGTAKWPVHWTVQPPSGTEILEGKLSLQCRTPAGTLQDSLVFTVFPTVRAKDSLTVFDPKGLTTHLLKQLGYGVKNWKGEPVPLLVVGREALSGGFALPASLEQYVRAGGKALVFTQHPQWLRQQIGWRVSPYVSRYAFAVDTTLPLLKNLPDVHFANWAGSGTLLKPEEWNDTTTVKGAYGLPYYGWRWGNTGSVSMGSVEKPHLSGWTPLLHNEFDLAYSPLMQLAYGKGLLVLNMLDMEGRTRPDAAASLLLQQLVQYVAQTVVEDRRSTLLIGTAEDSVRLQTLGLHFSTDTANIKQHSLLVIGPSVAVSVVQEANWLRQGKRLFYLSRTAGPAVREYLTVPATDTLTLKPWPETRGLSISDIRWRAEDSCWLLTERAIELNAGGLIGRKTAGNGVALYCQLDPFGLAVDQKPYLRLTRWRHTRTLVQLLSNMGASFRADAGFFRFEQKDKLETATWQQWYHPDYRADFEMGDDPFRYYRW